MIYGACIDISGMTECQYQTLYTRTSPQRRAQADRYLRQEDRLRCVVAEALLRYALRCCGHSQSPTVSLSQYGKPFLSDIPDFHFNLSHSGNYVAIAWGDTQVGIDVEVFRESPTLPSIAQKHFTPQEQDSLCVYPRDFFLIWTKKEAYVKYLGTGLRQKLSDFCVISKPPAHFESLDLPDACLTLCSQVPPQSITQLQFADIL